MRTNTSHFASVAVIAAMLMASFGCSGNSSGPGDAGPGDAVSGDSGIVSADGNAGDGGNQPASCDQTAQAGRCEITPTSPDHLAAAANICQQEGGTPGTTCPTANLVGCCTDNGGETCYYTSSVDAPDAEADCTGSGFAWSTTQ